MAVVTSVRSTSRAWCAIRSRRARGSTRGALTSSVPLAVRLLDDAIDASRYPLPAQRNEALRTRRIGLGVTGLADALVMLGFAYGSDAALDFATETMRAITHAAYRQSVLLAQEKGAFPAFHRIHNLPGSDVANELG